MRFLKNTLFLSGMATLASCSGDLSALDPAGPAAHSVSLLWWIMLWGSVGLFLLVLSLFFLTALSRKSSGIPASRWILWGGIVLPLPVLSALLIAAFVQGENIFGASAEEPAMTISVRASMWNWDMRYGTQGELGRSHNVLHIPAGSTVEIIVSSADVIHSFWVPRLGGKIDAVPGHENRIRLKADQPGTFGGICSEFCGYGHSAMRFTVISHEPAQYQTVLQSLQETQETP